MTSTSSAKYRLFYTQDGILTLTGSAVPETRGIVALALLRYLSRIQSIHFAEKSLDILEYKEDTCESLRSIYVLTTDEESICLRDLVQTIIAEEVTPWDSLRQRQEQKAGSAIGQLFNTCVLVVGCTLMSIKEKQNLIVCDLNSLNKSDVDPVSNLNFYEALCMRPLVDNKQTGGVSVHGAPKLILPGYILLLMDVCFSMKVPQFPKLMIRPQSQIWNLLEDLPLDCWSLDKHREASRLFEQLRYARMHCKIDNYTSILGKEIYTCCLRSMHLKPLTPELLPATKEIYKKTASVTGAKIVEPRDGRIQLKVNPRHGHIPVIISDVYCNEQYIKEITAKITQLAQQKACVLILLNSNFQGDFISVTNAPNKALLYIRDPFEDLFPISSEESSHDNTSDNDFNEPPFKRIEDNQLQSTAICHTTNHEARPLVEGPPLAALLPPYAITSRNVCYSVTPGPVMPVSPQDISDIIECEIKFSNLRLLWEHIQGNVYPYHCYAKSKDSRHLVYTSSPTARILSDTTLLIDITIIDNTIGQENAFVIVPHALFHELFLQITSSTMGQDIFELTDPETGANLRDELPCLWPKFVLCTIYELKIPQAKLLILHTKLPLPPDNVPPSEKHGVKYLLNLNFLAALNIK